MKNEDLIVKNKMESKQKQMNHFFIVHHSNLISNICSLFILLLALSSCEKFLDVESETDAKEKDLFSNRDGFCKALTGVYLKMAGRSLYGENLSMTVPDCMACLWSLTDGLYHPGLYDLINREYDNENGKTLVANIYTDLFNTILQVNLIIKNVQENGNSIGNTNLQQLIEGEAHALRAYMQFDLLRLWGQMPQQAATPVRLPYNETCSINDLPPYYDFDEYCHHLEADMDRADKLLKESDPLFTATFAQLNDRTHYTADDDYYYYRNARLNYWALQALKARYHLYLGHREEAHRLAMNLIEAKGPDGMPVIGLSGTQDIASGYLTLPNETLFGMSVYNIYDYTYELFLGNSKDYVTANKQLYITRPMLVTLYNGQNTASHNRYRKIWNSDAQDKTFNRYVTLCKFYREEGASYDYFNSLVPLIRMSEVYLIAIETSNDLGEAGRLYDSYMRDREVLTGGQTFHSADDVQQIVLEEYRREFYAEGVMFYVYKRRGITDMLWKTRDYTEDDMRLRLPDTEFAPTAR